MATKTEREKQTTDNNGSAPTAIVQHTDSRMTFRELHASDAVIPDTLAAIMEGEGFETQRHVKMLKGDMLRGIFRGMEDGELSARANSGEIPRCKWVYIETSDSTIVRLLGAYNLVTQLERAHDGQKVLIARGEDYSLPNGFRCTDYIVLLEKNFKPGVALGAAGAVVVLPSAPSAAKA